MRAKLTAKLRDTLWLDDSESLRVASNARESIVPHGQFYNGAMSGVAYERDPASGSFPDDVANGGRDKPDERKKLRCTLAAVPTPHA